MLNGRSTVIKASLLHETGKLITKNKKIATFFGFKKNEFKLINNITELIPKGIGEMHEALVHRMFVSG